MNEVSIIGLGAMGSTLARLLLGNGYRVTVWNRTTAKAEPLVRDGAVLATNAALAVGASPIVVVCVHDYNATNEILGAKEVAAAFAGRVLIQLTTGSPREALASEVWARQRGADYLDGAIQAAPSQMARPDTMILVSGAESAFRRSEPILNVFAGNVKYLGKEVGSASAMDLATLSYVYGTMLGFIHGARIAESEGFGVDHYGSLVAEISPTFGEFFKHEGAVIQSGNYAISESPLKISVEATERLAQAARESGINSEFPTFVSDSSREPWPQATKTRKSPPSSKCCAGRLCNGRLNREGRHKMREVSVIGLGTMGSALADGFLKLGHPTTVWNRSPEKADALVAKGALRASSVADAVAASELVVVCLLNYDAVSEALSPARDALSGRVLVNLTNGTPAQARGHGQVGSRARRRLSRRRHYGCSSDDRHARGALALQRVEGGIRRPPAGA